MKINKISGYLSLVAVSGLFFLAVSCDKTVDNSGAFPAHMDIYLTDSPGSYQGVWINLQSVMVDTSAADSGNGGAWKEVPLLRPGLYNLLDFRGGADTLLAGVDLPAGPVSQIRLVLGDGSYVVLNDGTDVPLTTPSGEESGIKLNIHADLKSGIPYSLVLDFDAARSVVKAGNSGKYLLKPVIRTFAKAEGGAMEGVVLPDSAGAEVTAILNEDTLGAIPDAQGYYKFWGLPEGNWQVLFVADSASGYQNDTLDNIAVKTGEVTKVDTVRLTR